MLFWETPTIINYLILISTAVLLHGENESVTEQSAKEKEADKSTSLSGCYYTPRLVTLPGIEPGIEP